MKLDWRVILAVSLFLAGTSPLMAQSGGFSEDFENGTTNWTLSGGSSNAVWAGDGSPSSVTGGAANTGANSLNFNNGVDYADTSSGTATSPVITLSSSGASTLTFFCNFETESDDANYGYDTRQITITPGNGSAIVETLGVTNAGTNVGACSSMGTWHQHSIPLTSSWGTIQVEFSFDSIDDILNDYDGWFIDGFSVSGGSSSNGGSSTGGTTPEKPSLVQGWNFDTGIGSWTVEGTNAAVTWAADGAPVAISGGNAFVSSPNSLNYNNGTDYDAGGITSSGTATSPKLDVSALVAPQITFACNFETEDVVSYDTRFLQISNDGFTGTPLLDLQLLSTGADGAIGNCSAIGTWHTHTVSLDPSWGTVQVRFAFDSIDEIANNYAGWFVDDVQLIALNGTAGSLQSAPYVNWSEGENGDSSINDTFCGGSIGGTEDAALPFGFILTGILLLGFSVRLRI